MVVLCAAVNPRANLKLLVMVGQETVMVGQMPAHAHPWLRHCVSPQIESIVSDLTKEHLSKEYSTLQKAVSDLSAKIDNLQAQELELSSKITDTSNVIGKHPSKSTPPPPPPPPPFKKLHTRSRYSNRAVNYSNKAVTMFMRQCSLPMKL